ncbi:uncharacterized protein METZ01_LOCUS337997, partial [marine metagenome]
MYIVFAVLLFVPTRTTYRAASMSTSALPTRRHTVIRNTLALTMDTAL